MNSIFNSTPAESLPKKSKKIFDYIHGLITIDTFFFKFIDTPQFQRLRDLYQLTTSNFVFPTANHTRFEHSLGTFSLSNKYITFLKQNQPELDISQSLINTVSLCGLCHNIGYSPYSNSFVSFCKENLNVNFDYHDMSAKIINQIIENEGIEPETQNEPEQFDLKELIKMVSHKEKSSHYYEQIANNTLNGIDADIFDYIRRDIYKYGFPQQSFDYQILMNNAYVINDDICYRSQDAYSVYDLFMSKFIMSKKFYLHRAAKATELMIKDIFALANPYFHFEEKIQNVDSFMELNDNIIGQIYHSKSPLLSEARNIVNRIYHRDLYAFAGEYDSSSLKSSFETFNEETLLKYTSSNEVKLTRNDIRIAKLKLNLGIDENDPITNVWFYDSEYNKVRVDRNEISHLLPNKFQERIIRVYITSKDEKKISSAQQALINFCKENGTAPSLYKSAKKVQKTYEHNFDENFLKKSLNLFN